MFVFKRSAGKFSPDGKQAAARQMPGVSSVSNRLLRIQPPHSEVNAQTNECLLAVGIMRVILGGWPRFFPIVAILLWRSFCLPSIRREP